MNRTLLRVIGALLAGVLLLGACGDDDDNGGDAATDTTAAAGTATTATGTAAGDTVTIKNFQFSALTVKGGTKVTVKNDDSVTHTYTANDEAFDTGQIEAGKSATFDAPGTAGDYPVHCNIHQSMTGTLKVT